LLLHSYLLVYENGFGGDRFRHLGSESRIISGLEYQPTLLSKNIWWKQIGPIGIPAALVDSAKLSYGTMWSLEVIAAKIVGLPVFQINRYLLPLLWSVFLTIIIYLLAYLLKPDKKFALMAALLSNSFYLFQYYGAQGLPASYGLIWLAFYLLFLINYIRDPNRQKIILLLAGLVLMYFNYSLAFLLSSIGLILAVALVKKKSLAYPISGMAILALVALDYLSSSAYKFIGFDKIFSIWTIGNLIDFESLSRFIPWIGEWHLLELVLLVVFLIALGVMLVRIFWRKDRAWLLMGLMAVIILVAYFLSYCFLDGEHSLARRLTLFAVLSLILMFASGLTEVMKSRRNWLIGGAGLVLLTMLTYYSGPALYISISDRDLSKASLMWHDLGGKTGYCIKDDEEVILALEFVSAKDFQETINNQNCQK
jgi:hypothetical protein